MTSEELLAAVLDEIKGLRADMKARPQASSGAQTVGGGTGAGGSQIVKFGRDKGKRLSDVPDLDWYRTAINNSVDDGSKARWRDQNLDDLAAVDAEIARRNGGQGSLATPGDTPPDFGAPPPGDDWEPPF